MSQLPCTRDESCRKVEAVSVRIHVSKDNVRLLMYWCISVHCVDLLRANMGGGGGEGRGELVIRINLCLLCSHGGH